MTWRLPGGDGILSGPTAELFRASLASVYDMMLEETGGLDPWEFGIPAFDRLAWPQRLALLVEVGECLLRPDIPAPDLTAVREAAVAAIAQNVDCQLAIEIDGAFVGEDSPPRFYWRRLVRAVLTEPGVLPPDEAVLEEINDDIDEWRFVAECYFWDTLLWDEDWLEEETQDAAPHAAALVKNRLGIADGYYSAIAPDPKPDEIIPLIRRMDALIGGISKDDRYFSPGFVPENLEFD